MSGDGKRIELIDDDPDGSSVTSYIGLGLIGSLIIGFSPLRDAVVGNGPFEDAMLRFLACVAVSVGAATVIGRLLDSAPSKGATRVAHDGHDESDTNFEPNPPVFDDSADGMNTT